MAKNLENKLKAGFMENLFRKTRKAGSILSALGILSLGSGCGNPVEPENHAPKITSTPVTQVDENKNYQYQVQASDEDGDKITYSLIEKPNWISVSNSSVIGVAPDVPKDTDVDVKLTASDGQASTSQTWKITIKDTTPQAKISQSVALNNYTDIIYNASMTNIDKAVLEVLHNDAKVDSLSREINTPSYADTLRGRCKGRWKFNLKAAGVNPDEKSVEVPNYNPEADFSSMQGKLDFEEGEQLGLALPAPKDKNPEDAPVHYTNATSSDGKTNAEVRNDSLFVNGKPNQTGNYQLELEFGSIEGGLTKKVLSGEIIPYQTNYLNPFARPKKTKDCYGSGDTNGDGLITIADANAIDSGISNNMSDVNGDGITDSADRNLIQNYVQGVIPYLPGDWEKLQSKEERDEWVRKMIAIDQTDKIVYKEGDLETRFVSGNFATQLCFNFLGYDGIVPYIKYDVSRNRRFNLPMDWVQVNANNGGHGMNAILTGENPLNFYDWNFIEPQNDSTLVKPKERSWDMPYNNTIEIYAPNGFKSSHDPDMIIGDKRLVLFKIDGSGNPSLIYQNPNLVVNKQ